MRNKNGFTLIELIIVMAVAGILSVVGIASFVTYNKTQEVNMAAQDLANMLNSAKSKAQAQVMPEGCNSPLAGYRVVFCESGGCLAGDTSSDYALYAYCESPAILVDPGVENAKKLPGTVTLSSPTSYFLFKVMYSDVDFTGSGIITLTGDGGTKTITVRNDGSVTVQ